MTSQPTTADLEQAIAENPTIAPETVEEFTRVEGTTYHSGAITDPVVEVRNLNLWYGKVQALTDVSLSFPRNKITALIGPSGCGKSTLLRCINRMNDLIKNCRVDGTVAVEGQNIYDKGIDPVEVRRRIGMVFQKPNPFPRSIRENILYGAKINGYRGDRAAWRSLAGSNSGSASLGQSLSRPM